MRNLGIRQARFLDTDNLISVYQEFRQRIQQNSCDGSLIPMRSSPNPHCRSPLHHHCVKKTMALYESLDDLLCGKIPPKIGLPGFYEQTACWILAILATQWYTIPCAWTSHDIPTNNVLLVKIASGRWLVVYISTSTIILAVVKNRDSFNPLLVGGWATPRKNMTSSIGMIY